MVRVYLRPCATAFAAIGRRHARPSFRAAVRPLGHDVLGVHSLFRSSSNSQLISRSISSKSKDKDSKKKAAVLHEKFDGEEDAVIIETPPPEVQFLATEESEETEFDEEELELIRAKIEGLDIEEDEDDNEDSAEVAAKIEREIANWDLNEYDEGALEDDRLHIEMPGYDASMNIVSDDILDDEADEFENWNHGMAHTPEMLNWMLPKDQRQPFKAGTEKPWKHFVNSKHSDVVELALDTDLLRLFISPTGRIRPRRFTGLTAKQQRQLAQGIKISRQLGLLPYLSRYPEPSPEQWRQIHEEEDAKLAAQLENMTEEEEDNDYDLDELEAQ